MPSIALPHAETFLVVDPEVPADPHATRWLLRRGGQQRAVRIRLSHLGEWVLVPQPESDADRRRAEAQKAIPFLEQAMEAPEFFAQGQGEFEVVINAFHPHMNAQHQLPWDPQSTPYLP